MRPTQTGVLDNGTHFRAKFPDLVTLPQLFKNHGYVVLRHGKVFHGGKEDAPSWTNPAPQGKPKSAPQDPDDKPGPVVATRVINPNGKPTTQRVGKETPQMIASDQRVILAGNGEGHADYKTADETIAALSAHKHQPFFITCGFLKPHAEPAAPQKFYDLYPPDKIMLPEDFAPFPTPPKGFPLAALNKNNTDLFWNREANAAEARLMIQAYRASASWMDWNVGRVLKALDDNGLRGNTIVVFWGDHGYHLGEMGKWSKHDSLFDIGTRVPLLIVAPAAKGNGKASPRIVETLDIFPTLAALCGLDVPQQVQGRNLQPLLNDPNAAWDHPAISVAGKGAQVHRTIRTERWRYLEWSGPEGGNALIDEQNDPHERQNLVNAPKHADLIERLKAQMNEALAPMHNP
jgi:arylsulfatase A-like enzyme